MAETRVKFRGEDCVLVHRVYAEGEGVRLELQCLDGSPMAVCTVNVPEVTLAADEVIVKDWGGNEGMVGALVAAGVVAVPSRTVEVGFVVAHVCRLLVPPPPEPDFAGIEQRILDMHQQRADKEGTTREEAKVRNFAEAYGRPASTVTGRFKASAPAPAHRPRKPGEGGRS